MHDPTARSTLSPTSSCSAWLLTPADLAAILADDRLRDRLATGEHPARTAPAGARLAAWVREIEDRGTS